MTLEEKQAELQEAVEAAETLFEAARLRSRRAELEVESAHRHKVDIDRNLTLAKRQLLTFAAYLDPRKN